VPVSPKKAKAGDLVFWRSSHVELFVRLKKRHGKWGYVTFGAHSSRNPIIGYRFTYGTPHVEYVKIKGEKR
jgi:hypothetical protein